MRTKSSSGGRARYRCLPPQPSPSALKLIGQAMNVMDEDEAANAMDKDNDLQDMNPETLSSSNNAEESHHLPFDASAEMTSPGNDHDVLVGQAMAVVNKDRDMQAVNPETFSSSDNVHESQVSDTSAKMTTPGEKVMKVMDVENDTQAMNAETSSNGDDVEESHDLVLGTKKRCLTPKPSPSALNLIGQAVKEMRKEKKILATYSDSYNVEESHDTASDTSGEMTTPGGKVRVRMHNFLESKWREHGYCIKCDSGGKLLVCGDSGCPLAVHEECLGCLAKFDDTGNFCCPYCWYKQAIRKVCQAREKTVLAKKILSNFIDNKMVHSSPEQKKSGIEMKKDSTLSTVAGSENENRPESNDINNKPLEIGEDHRKEVNAPDCTTSISLQKRAEINKQTDTLMYGCSVNAGHNCDDHVVAVEDQIDSELVVVSGSDDLYCSEEGTRNISVTLDVRESLEAEPCRQAHDNQPEQAGKDENEEEYSIASSREEETILASEAHLSKEKLNDAVTFKEIEGEVGEDAQPQKHTLETASRLTCHEPALAVQSRAKEGIRTNLETISSGQKNAKRKDRSEVQHLNVRRSPRNLRSSAMQNEKKLREEEPSKPITKPPFLTARRKKLIWRDAEEEILAEGVQKFSSTVNKNVPWRKILEFGSHVFDASRTPVDLKDKWRNMRR